MKKLTLLIICFLSVQLLLSQTVLTNNINFSIGDTYRYNGYEEVTNIEPGPGGANQNWDFSQVTGPLFIEGDGNICVEPSSSVFGDSAAVSDANICIRNIDEEISPYQYYNCKNSSQELLAMGFVSGSNSSFGTYTDILTAHEFPFAYGDSFNDTWELLTYHIDFGYYMMRDSSTVLVEADAYGTVVTPTGTYQNALRIKRTTVMYSWFRWEEGGEWNPSGPYTDIDYEWYAPDIKVPVMIITEFDGFTDYSVRYMVEYNSTTGILAEDANTMEVFPNPTSDKLTIKTKTPIETLDLYSITGELLFSNHHPSQLQQAIEMSSYSKGVYFIKIKYEDDTYVTQRIIKN